MRRDGVGERWVDQRRARIDVGADDCQLVGAVGQHHDGVAGDFRGGSGGGGDADGGDAGFADHLDADPVLGPAAVGDDAGGNLGGVHGAAAAQAQDHGGFGLADGFGAGVHAVGGRFRLRLVPDVSVDVRLRQLVGDAFDHTGFDQALVGDDQHRAVGDAAYVLRQFIQAAASEDDGGGGAVGPAVEQVGHATGFRWGAGHYVGKRPTMRWTAAGRIPQ